MSEDQIPKKPSRDHKRTTVRFTDEEFKRITEEARMSRFSIPELLKKSHFKQRKLKLLLDPFDTKFVCYEIRRISNEVSSIANKVNKGAMEGWHDEFSKVANALNVIQQMVVSAYGNR